APLRRSPTTSSLRPAGSWPTCLPPSAASQSGRRRGSEKGVGSLFAVFKKTPDPFFCITVFALLTKSTVVGLPQLGGLSLWSRYHKWRGPDPSAARRLRVSR